MMKNMNNHFFVFHNVVPLFDLRQYYKSIIDNDSKMTYHYYSHQLYIRIMAFFLLSSVYVYKYQREREETKKTLILVPFYTTCV